MDLLRSSDSPSGADEFLTLIPARLDRLPWSRFHMLIVVGLGITWALDGLEVTLMGAIGAVLQRPDTLGLDAAQIGFISSCYLAGAVAGALVFGHLTDRHGRRRFFFISLALYLIGVALTACAWNLASVAIFRTLTGAGIGGEYAAVNSAIDELVPARIRGRVDLIVNGSFWLGAAAGSLSGIVLLNPRFVPYRFGWRIGFAIGAVIGLAILYLRNFIPESPRWLLTHGYPGEAEEVVVEIERAVEYRIGCKLNLPGATLAVRIRRRGPIGIAGALRTIAIRYWRRALLGLTLMVAQAFTYNAIFFTYAIVLNRFYGVAAARAAAYLLPFAAANFAGPVIMSPLFDTVGRRRMIAATYAIAALILILTGAMFARGMLTSFEQGLLWTLMFFFASPAASSAYLTVSEIFPLEIRALSIAIFFAAGTMIGGIAAPWFFGRLIDTGSRAALLHGYLTAAALMLLAATVEMIIGVPAERQSLEQIAPPLAAE
jgi:MFS family permease